MCDMNILLDSAPHPVEIVYKSLGSNGLQVIAKFRF